MEIVEFEAVDEKLLCPKDVRYWMTPLDYLKDDKEGYESNLLKYENNILLFYFLFNRNYREEFIKRINSRPLNAITKLIDDKRTVVNVLLFIREFYLHLSESIIKENECILMIQKLLLEIFSNLNETAFLNNTKEKNKKIQKIESEIRKINKIEILFPLGVETKSISIFEIKSLYEELQIIKSSLFSWENTLKNMRFKNDNR